MSANVLQYAQGNNVSDTLSSSIGASDTSIPVNSISLWNSNGGTIIIDRGLSTQEICKCSGVSGSSLVITQRGAEGTTAVGHNVGATVESVPTAGDWNNVITTLLNAFLQTTGALDTTKVVDLTTSQTLTNKSLAESSLTFTDITTGNVSTTKHGFAPKLPNDATKFLDGTGNYSSPNSSTDGWLSSSDTWTYASASSFTITGVDRTAVYTKGTRVKFTNNSTTFYGVVISSSFSTNTTINLAPNSDYSISNSAITSPYYSYQINPQGYPTWFNYTPSYGAGGSMTYTSVTTNLAKFRVDGKSCTVVISATGTTGGSANSVITFTLPISADATAYRTGGAVDDPTGFAAWFANYSTAGSVNCSRYDSSNFGLGSGRSIYCTFSFGF